MDTKVQWHENLSIAKDSTLHQALHVSGWLNREPLAWFGEWLSTIEVDTTPNHKAWHVGVYAHKQPLNYILQNGDRIEIYRPLIIDPMNKRKAKSKRVYKHKPAKLGFLMR